MKSIRDQDVRVESGGGPRAGAGRHHDPHPAGRAAAQAECSEQVSSQDQARGVPGGGRVDIIDMIRIVHIILNLPQTCNVSK